MVDGILPDPTASEDIFEKAQEPQSPLDHGTSESDDASRHKRSGEVEGTWSWDTDPHNPYNWTSGQKALQVTAIASIAFIASMGTSIMSAAPTQLRAEFGVTTTQAILPLSLYVFALALGPVVGGPLSETVGRLPVYTGGLILGTLFTLGAGFTQSFAGLNILRFLAGFGFAPSLAIAFGSVNEMYKPVERAIPSTFLILTPFLGPGIGPIIGSFVTNRKGWRWTQWTMLFFCAFCLLLILPFGRETFHPILLRRRTKALGHPTPPSPSHRERLRQFVTTTLFRPLTMLLTEPIVGLVCLYVSCEFATLFTFFAAVPFIFDRVYNFSVEQSGLVFISVVVGCVLGTLTILACDIFLYRKEIPKHPPHQVPPEYRLYPAMIGSVGLPLGLFWLAWTARRDIHWASPVVAIVPFAWGNLCVFVSTSQFTVDTYRGTVIASASSANSLTRYGLAGAFPLFAVQMYTNLGINWATSLLGFISVALLPVPWVFFKYGKKIRSRSRYETPEY
ncbi:major facilitator superfamily transporter [Podospora aff. communis PSN243]|uniref:Major facilitator superfamily transporter n=1 Tax=Podospora aff. communis PSN243 TaxID=3040156 RepID=A0AAV9FYP8_9PEZI|nr:major facilitator superfamily transporter [Podospora aff. communis PSN243]